MNTAILPAQVERLTADGATILLRRVAPRMTSPDEGPRRPAEASRYAVEVDGVLRGHIAYPYGFESSWEAYSLGRCAPGSPGPTRLFGPLSAQGTYVRRDRRGLARLFPGWIAAGLAPTEEEIARHREAEAAARTLQEAEQAEAQQEDDARWARIRGDIARRDAARAEETAQRLDAMRTLRERGPAALTNAEIDALEWAIAALSAKPPR